MSKLVLVQVLRAAAALSVAMLHAQHDAATLAERGAQAFTPIEAFPWEAGVDVFFVISGFIMVHASAPLFGTEGAGRIFLARRIARIVPVYWAVTTLYLAIALAVPALLNAELLGWGHVVASYLFIPTARPDGNVQPLYGLGWTLNYEMFFYILFAVAVAWPRRRAVPALAAVLIGLVAVGLLLRPLPQPLGFWTDPIVLEFVYGMALGYFHAKGIRLGPVARALLGGAAILALIAVASRLGIWTIPYRALAYGLPAAMLVAAVALGRERRNEGRLANIGAAVGDASYALYLIHPFAIRAGREVVWRSGLGGVIGPWTFVVLALAASVLAAVVVYRLFERPATAWVRARLKT
ncbi:MAG TPA: acyltransferase [Beijerinckiaceae bacterium]